MNAMFIKMIGPERRMKMNKILFPAISMLFFLLLPALVSAHTNLKSSNPSEGQVVKEDFSEILLEFEGDIEELSTMKLLKDGQEIPLDQIQIMGQQMIGELSQPLEDGSYLIQWNIAGEDSHPIEGTITFKVQVQQELDNPNPSTENQEDEQDLNEQEDEPKIYKQNENHNKSNFNQKRNHLSSNFMINMAIVLLFLIIVIGLLLLLRRKR
jgi:copper resistance protein C